MDTSADLWQPRGLRRRLLFKSVDGGWRWTRRAVLYYSVFGKGGDG